MRVAILVNNPVSNDSRVLKNAVTTAQRGHDVLVFGRMKPTDEHAVAESERGFRIVRKIRLSRPGTMRWLARFSAQQRALPLTRPTLVLIASSILVFLASILFAIRWSIRWSLVTAKRIIVLSLNIAKSLLAKLKYYAKRATHIHRLRSWDQLTTGTADTTLDMETASAPHGGVRQHIGDFGGYLRRSLHEAGQTIGSQAVGAVFRFPPLHQSASLIFSQLEMLAATYDDILDFRPDVIYANDLDTLLCARWAARTLGIPFIYDAHELETARSTRSGAITSHATYELETSQAREAALVLTVSDGIADILRPRFAPVPVKVVHNVPFRRDKPVEGDTVRETLQLPDDKFLMIYVGLISIHRALELFIDATAQLDERHNLVLVGPFHNPDYVASLRDRAREKGIQARFHILPPVPADNVPHFVSSADLSLALQPCVTESYRLAMPNKLFESSLSGVPLLYSPEQICIAEFIERHGLGVPIELPLCAENIAEGVRNAERSFTKIDEEKLAAFRERYSWQTELECVLSFYDEIAEKQSAGVGQGENYAPAVQ